MSKAQFDPRTVAREIPGLFDAVFPQLTPGVVAHLNREAAFVKIPAIEAAVLSAATLAPAMLAELAFAVAERKLSGVAEDWDQSLQLAVRRQRRYYDFVAPLSLSESDRFAAASLASNLVDMVSEFVGASEATTLAPWIPGFQWISSGVGDLAAGQVLIEVKFSSRGFSSADYRQVVVYWLLAYMASQESDSFVWKEFVLLNPKRGVSVRVKFSTVLDIISAGRSLLEVTQVFRTLVSTRGEKPV